MQPLKGFLSLLNGDVMLTRVCVSLILQKTCSTWAQNCLLKGSAANNTIPISLTD